MKQEEEEREKKLNELKRKENIISETNINNGDEGNKIDSKEEKIDVDQKNMTVINDNNNINVFRDELSEKEKELLEKNWKTSTKPEFGEKIINEKGDKEIIRDENKVAKKVAKKEKKKEKMEKMIYHKPEVLPSMVKFFLI